MGGIMQMVANNVAPATAAAIPTPTLYLDATDYAGTGTTWTAATGSDATLVNTPVFNAASPTYFDFDDASGEYATVPNLGNLSQWTVEAWFRLDTVLGAGDVTSVVTNQFDLVNKLNFSIGTNRQPTNANICAGFFDGAWRTTTGFAASADVWYHVVGTYDGTTVRQYVDGGQQSTLTYSGTPQSGGEVRIAARWDLLSAPNDFFPGDIGLVRIWNTALSAQQVTELYNENLSRFSNSVVTANLVAYWDPDLVASYPGTGTTINNLTTTSLPGTMSNITYTDPYFAYNGTSSTVSIADNAVLEPGAGDFTVEAWVYYSVITGSSRVILGKTNGGLASDWGYGIRTGSNGGTYMEVGNGTTSVTSPSYTVSTGQWYQIVGVWTNVAANSIELYINGASQGSNSHAFASVKNTANPLYLGSFDGGGVFGQWFNGRMGIVRYYSAALTAAEVQQNFDANRAIYGI